MMVFVVHVVKYDDTWTSSALAHELSCWCDHQHLSTPGKFRRALVDVKLLSQPHHLPLRRKSSQFTSLMVHIVILFHTYTFAFIIFIFFFIRSTQFHIDSSEKMAIGQALLIKPSKQKTAIQQKQHQRLQGQEIEQVNKPIVLQEQSLQFEQSLELVQTLLGASVGLAFAPDIFKILICSTRSVVCPSFGTSYWIYSHPNTPKP